MSRGNNVPKAEGGIAQGMKFPPLSLRQLPPQAGGAMIH
ncbi:hypothetical protein HPSSW140_0815 [Glaesserella parasuis SW140]|nr:hypothetical protein HPSSW140_0815 [Glaesserella parasuis SW140]